MGSPRTREMGFTLVELMIVVLIIGILVSIAVPIYAQASTDAQYKACQSNQRTLSGVVTIYISDGDSTAAASAGQFAAGGSGWYGLLVPGWLKSAPTCPLGSTNYLLDAAGNIRGDQGATVGFKPGHVAP